MNWGRSCWPPWSQQLRVQRATPGSASTKVRRRQVPPAEGTGRGEASGEVEAVSPGEGVLPGRWASLEAAGRPRGKVRKPQAQSRPHSPPAPPWSPLAALAKPRLRDLRGKAIAVREAGTPLSSQSPSPSPSRPSPLLGPITC